MAFHNYMPMFTLSQAKMRTCLLKRDEAQEVSMGEQCNPRHKYSENTLLYKNKSYCIVL
jgi:hypothetical protein